MDKLSSEEIRDIGLRFKSARSLVGLNRKDFCQKHQLNWHTVQTWEIGRSVSRGRSLSKFCEALNQEGVFCSQEWLLRGHGSPPTKVPAQSGFEPAALPQTSPVGASLTQQAIDKEITLFRKNHKQIGVETLTSSVADSSMQPFFFRGDLVGGITLKGSSVARLLGKACIVDLGDSQLLIRRLRIEGKRFLLLPENFNYPIISVSKIERAAEVIWFRRPVELFE